MKTQPSASINLPALSDAEAYHLVSTFYELLFIVDSHYAVQLSRYTVQCNAKHPDAPPPDYDHDDEELDLDDSIPF